MQQPLFLDRRNRSRDKYIGGTPVIVDLDAGGKVTDLSVILTGTVVVSGGTTSGTQIGDGLPNLIKRIQLDMQADSGSPYPSGLYVDVTPRSLLRFAMVQRKGKYMAERALSGAANLGNGAAGTYKFYLEIPIFFSDPTSRFPLASALNMDRGLWKSAQLKIDLANDLTGCFAGNDRAVDFSQVFVDTKDTRLNLPGFSAPVIQHEHVSLIDATFDRKPDKGMPSDGSFLQWLILAEQGSGQTLSDGLLNKLTVTGVNGVLEEYALDVANRGYTDEWYDPASSIVGQYFIDWTSGNQNNAQPASGLSTQFDQNLVSAANQDQFRIFTRRTLPLASSGN